MGVSAFWYEVIIGGVGIVLMVMAMFFAMGFGIECTKVVTIIRGGLKPPDPVRPMWPALFSVFFFIVGLICLLVQ